MSSSTVHEKPASGLSKTRRRLADRRRSLLLPILLLVILALTGVCALLYWSADALNRRQGEAQTSLVSSMLDSQRQDLRSLVIDYAWWDEAIVTLGVGLDERWAKEELGDYLLEAFGINCIWVLGPDNETRVAFIDGQASESDIFDRLPRSVERLLEAARQGRTIDQVPSAGFISIDGQLEIVAASIVSPFDSIALPPAPEDAPVVVFVRPLRENFFNASSLNTLMEMPRFSEHPPGAGFLGRQLTDVDNHPLGYIVWSDSRPGDDLLWGGAPLLVVALLVLVLLLALTVRRVEAVVLREGRLSVSLDHERQRRQDKSRFVSMVSHELRTPLQAIGSAADMLDRYGDQMSLTERQEETRTIRRGVAALARLVDDILVVGRVEAPTHSGEGKTVDLAALCSAVWREVSLALKATHELRLVDKIGTPVEGGAEVMLHAVLSNLLQNAAKYSPDGTEIEVELAEEAVGYKVSVRDQGVGVPAAMREAVFEPYWRAEATSGVEGAGLGLPVARAAARSMGGDITIESDDLEKGTRFVLRWPHH